MVLMMMKMDKHLHKYFQWIVMMIYHKMIEDDLNNLNEDIDLVDLFQLDYKLIDLDFVDKLKMKMKLNYLMYHIHYYCH
jgi:hypothetical protein